MGMVHRKGDEPGAPKPLTQLRSPVDANVSAGRSSVLPRQAPVHRLRPEAGHGHDRLATGPEDSGDLSHSALVLSDVFENLRRDQAIERTRFERKVQRISHATAACRLSRYLSLGLHRLRHALDVLQGRVVDVYRDSASASRQSFKSVPPGAAAEIEHGVTRVNAQQVVANRQHEAITDR
jgi:hypothetical protein